MKTRIILTLFFSLLLVLINGCTEKSDDFSINYEKFILDNGLEVIMHIDRSDPVVAVSMTCHVGSSRELPGKTGFAHLFEHLLFNESENLGRGGLDALSARVGGSGANGSTSRDRTNYFQTVPKDALEKMLWAEADKLGWFINTVTDPVLAKEKQVVKNEKRQSYDNRPYGNSSYITGINLYPEGHPYSWQVIGSLEDLSNATLQDVKDFYNRWYVPNNVTLVIAGDFDTAKAKEWVEKYFGEIKPGNDLPEVKKLPVTLNNTKKVLYQDKFARLPELTMTWPTVAEFDPDSYPLSILTTYLSDGKRAPLYKSIVEEKGIAPSVNMGNYSSEIAGETEISVRAYSEIDLDDVFVAVNDGLKSFEENGIPAKDLERIKAGRELAFYSRLSSVLGKANQLAEYNIFAGDPGYATKDIKSLLAVTADDVMRVYNKYIKDKNYVVTSFVPVGSTDLGLEGSEEVTIPEESITEDVGEGFDVNQIETYEKTPSEIDRSIEPPYGEKVILPVPQVWIDSTSNGIKIFGIQNSEVPLVQFNMRIKGGLLADDPARPGIANLTAQLMNRGTSEKTPAELEEAIESLGASINISSGNEAITISGRTLARNFNKTMDLLTEMLLEPRWDSSEFELVRKQDINALRQMKANPGSIASNEFRKIIYGRDNILSNNNYGSVESIESSSIDDLKDYYHTWFVPSGTILNVVGDVNPGQVMSSLSEIVAKWEGKEVGLPEYKAPVPPDASKVFFYDFPGARQSVLMFGYPALAAVDDDFYPANVMNYILGGGGFASRLTQVLRQEKGYTYGIRSRFSGTALKGPFTISSSVKTSITLEAATLVRDILDEYNKTFSDEDLEVTKGFLTKSNARAFETLSAKLNMLNNISLFGWPFDYVTRREEVVSNMTVEKIRELASKYADPDRMFYLFVGDAATQASRLKELGYGDPVILNR